MQLNKLYSSMGNTRAEHAAMIAMHGQNWADYIEMHNDVFAEHNLRKYHVLNAEGKMITNGDDKQALVTNANGTIRHEDFLVIRDTVVEVRRKSLNGVTDLKASGLSFGVSLGDQLVGFENINEFEEAKQDMNPTNYNNNDTVFTEDFVPNPITHSTFQIPWRQEGFNYKRSLGLVENTRQVAERLEETLTNGNANIAVTFNGTSFPIYGYTTDPSRGTGTISDWTAGASQGLIVNELIDQIGAMWTNQGGVGNNSVMVYVANDIWNVLQKDYSTTHPSKRIVDRMKDIAQVKDVKPLEKLASTQVVLVEMEKRTVELAIASDIIVTPHTKTSPMMPQVLTSYAAMVHKIKADSNGNTGVRHLTV